MNNVDIAKKNYERGLWTEEMLDKLEAAGKITKADKDKIKSDHAAKTREE